MLAKARATLAGKNEGFAFGCPVDHTCMARLGVSPALVLEVAGRHLDDALALDELRKRGIPPAVDAWFAAPAVEDDLQERGVYLRVRARDALPETDGGRVFCGLEHGAGVSVVLIDAAPGVRQEWHVHPVEEVVAVQDGWATFSLGALQARAVRAGEVVRVPAGEPHRWCNDGAERFGAVAAYG